MIYGFEPFSGPMHLGPKTGRLCPAFYGALLRYQNARWPPHLIS